MSSTPGKTAPRLFHDLLTYDPRYEERAGRNLLTSSPPQYNPDGPRVAAVPFRNCRHRFLNKSEQCQLPKAGEDADHTTVYKVASFCPQCRWHLDLLVDFRDDGPKSEPCRKGRVAYPLHHFIFQGEEGVSGGDAFGNCNVPRIYRFRCSASKCPVELKISLKPPQFSDQDITIMTNRAHLRKRWDMAKQLAGDRADTNMARPVDAPDFLNTYLQDSLNPQKGKARIPLLNRKFLKTFGKDCDSILKRLGFTNAVEIEDDGTAVDVWYLPKPPEAQHPPEPSPRNIIEDARYELNTIILNFAESERVGARHVPMYPSPSQNDIERVLGCYEYDKVKGRVETRSMNREEDHPYYAGLGAVGDFSDALLLYAFNRQQDVDKVNASYYFECLQDLAVGRGSNDLQMEVATLASKGYFNRREVGIAYRYFGINPEHADSINDEHVIGVFRSRLSDISPSLIEETRKQLRIIGHARNSDRIVHEASDAIETYEQALSWLDLDASQVDDFVTTMFSLKTSDNPASVETARNAVAIIAKHRNSKRLRDYLEKGSMAEPAMDLGEACALLGVADRTGLVDLEVLQTQVTEYAAQNPGSAEKYQQAFDLISQDQAENHNNRPGNMPIQRRNQYPLESWPVGLCNIGNTCYLNSVLQFLFTIKPLRDMVINCDENLQNLDPEALKTKKVGRSVVTAERVETAQQFVRELRTFFQHMITAPIDTVRPVQNLAALALTKTDATTTTESVQEQPTVHGPGLGKIAGLPVSGPLPPPAEVNENESSEKSVQADSVIGGDNEDTKSDADSMAAMDLTADSTTQDSEKTNIPKPPSRPPPVPPRPQASTETSVKAKIESYAQQQDAAEILNNIFDLLSCAFKGESVMQDGEQFDLIKRLFFFDVTTVRTGKDGKTTSKSDIQDNLHISTKDRQRHIYAALDDEFGLNELDNGEQKYEFITEASPIQIINVRRLQFEGGKARKDDSHVGLDKILYFDRYLSKTKSLSEAELQKLREAQWEKQQELRSLEAERKRLKETEFKDMSVADVAEQTADFLENLAKINENQLISLEEDSLTTPPELPHLVREKADVVRKNIEAIDEPMSQLEQEIDTVFKNCKDHPYRLHAIFTHAGTATGGHYWIYIYDFQNNIWRKYNDEYVEEIDEKAVFERVQSTNPPISTGIVYIRDDAVDELTQAVFRKPDESQIQQASTTGDVQMHDVDDDQPPPLVNMDEAWNDVQVINGVEKE